VKLVTINRVFFSFIVSGRLFREKWPVYFLLDSVSDFSKLYLILRLLKMWFVGDTSVEGNSVHPKTDLSYKFIKQ
jgi:hypothetical protein